MKTSKQPPNPWFIAITTPVLAAHGFPPGTRVVVRESRAGGWRVVSKTRHLEVGARGIGRMVNFTHGPGETLMRADQGKAEVHFQGLLRGDLFAGMR